MRRYLSWMIFVAASCGVAHAAKHKTSFDKWEAVEQLVPGAEINVWTGGMQNLSLCRVAAVDATGLTCFDENGAGDKRLVYQRDEVLEVSVFETVRKSHKWRWILLAGSTGVGLGLIPLVPLAGGIILLIPVELALESIEDGLFTLLLPPRSSQLRRRLVYRVATP